MSDIKLVGGMMYVSNTSRKIKFEPIIAKLESSLDDWPVEERVCKALKAFGPHIPSELIPRYVSAITLTFVGYKGSGSIFARTDFYSNGASRYIRKMFNSFDNESVKAFIETIHESKILKKRIKLSGQLKRLRILGNILLEKGHFEKDSINFLNILVDEDETGTFYDAIGE